MERQNERQEWNAEVIAVGDELVSGQRLDTNSQWLSQELGELGIRVDFHTAIGDSLANQVRAVRDAMERADIVLMTGGLGPTADDLTREALAEAAQVPLHLDPESLEHIEGLFRRRQRTMPQRNRVQAMFPQGSRIIPNPHGSAPGIDMDFPRPGRPAARVVALPGVPAEMKEMWEQTVAPRLQQQVAGQRQVIRHFRLKCFGVGESHLEAMLPDLIRRGREPSVGITVSRATITLRITARGTDEQSCQQQIDETSQVIRQCLGDLVFGCEDQELQHVVIEELQARGQTLAALEWGSRGRVSQWLASADDQANTQVFRGGTVIRALPQLESVEATPSVEQLLTILERSAVEMKEKLEADWGVAVGPYPRPQSEDDRFAMALAGPQGTTSSIGHYSGHPDILDSRAAKQCLDFLRRQIASSQYPVGPEPNPGKKL